MCSGETGEDIWLHPRSWDNRVEVDFAFPREQYWQISWFLLAHNGSSMLRYEELPVHSHKRAPVQSDLRMSPSAVQVPRKTGAADNMGAKWHQQLAATSQYNPSALVGRQPMEGFKRQGRQLGKQDFNFRRQGLSRREQKRPVEPNLKWKVDSRSQTSALVRTTGVGRNASNILTVYTWRWDRFFLDS